MYLSVCMGSDEGSGNPCSRRGIFKSMYQLWIRNVLVVDHTFQSLLIRVGARNSTCRRGLRKIDPLFGTCEL